MLFVTPVNKKSHEVERLRMTTVSFPVILFHSKSNQTGIYNLSVKYRIDYRYRQISVIKNRNIGISVFSHIGASLLNICNIDQFTCFFYRMSSDELSSFTLTDSLGGFSETIHRKSIYR